MIAGNTQANGLPLNVVPGLVPGATNSSAQAQAAAAVNNGMAKMNALKAVTGGYKKHSKLLSGGLALQALPNSFPSSSPVNSGLQSLNAQTFSLANQGTASAVGDKGGEAVVIKTGGRRKWSAKYKKSINCSKPKGFSQRQYCKYGRNGKKGGTKRHRRPIKRSRRT
jgi:hypothetical protein